MHEGPQISPSVYKKKMNMGEIFNVITMIFANSQYLLTMLSLNENHTMEARETRERNETHVVKLEQKQMR